MAAQQDVDIDAMDWGPGVIEIGTQEAEDAMTALVSAAVEVDGAPAGPAGSRKRHSTSNICNMTGPTKTKPPL